MGFKSRGNFQVNGCFKKCDNRDKRCDDCVGSNLWKPLDKKQSKEK